MTIGASFVSSERSLRDLNDTLWCAIFVIQAFEFDFIFENLEFSSLLFSFEHCSSYLFSLPISLIISHYAYIFQM